MQKSVLLILLTAICLSLCNLLCAQIKEEPFVLSIGSGFVSVSGKKGTLLHLQANKKRYKNFGITANFGMVTAASSTKNFNINAPGMYAATTYSYLNAGPFYQQPLLNGKMNIVFDATAGVRKNNSLEVLVNSNRETATVKDKSIRFGFNPGISTNYKIAGKHSIGLMYRHDFYYEGTDFFLVNWFYEL